MGPRRDFIAELGVAVRRRGMKFGVSSRQGKNPATTLMSSELDAGCWMESRQPRFLRDQSRQAAGLDSGIQRGGVLLHSVLTEEITRDYDNKAWRKGK